MTDVAHGRRTRRRARLARLAAVSVAALAALAPATAAAGERPDLSHLRPPTALPAAGDQASAESSGRWIVAVRSRSRALGARLARRYGLRPADRVLGIYVASAPTAARFAGALRRHEALWYAEPDIRAVRRAFPLDPLSPTQWWIPVVVPPPLMPPPPGGAPVAVVDDGVDIGHPDLAPNVTLGAPQRPDHEIEHGTAVASVIAAPANGTGIVGVLPGQPTLVFPMDLTCAEVTRRVRAASAVANVINMSYGFEGGCFTHFVATQLAIRRGALPVAAAGNEFQEGNPLSRPANDPHVLNVGALNPDLSSADFSNENEGVDLVAPGVDIPVAVPQGTTPTGFDVVDGTSFAAPIVAAAASWVRRVRPGLDPIQTSDVLRDGARDLGVRGFDERFGFGLVDIAGALAAPKPVRERREPNEDIAFVNGRHFARQGPLLMRGRRAIHVGFLDAAKDPVDVIPVRVRGRSSLQIGLTPRGADVDVEVFTDRARTVHYEGRPPRTLIAAGVRVGTRRERVTVDNPGRRARTAYLAIFNADPDEIRASYRLVVSRRALRA